MKVSAVVPVFNSIQTLERAINSLLIQQEINEIFIIDDGSTDGSYDLELELEKNNRIIKVLTHFNRINKGASASRNLGLKNCSNTWIQFLDADDEILPNKIYNNLIYINYNISLLVGNSLYRKFDKEYKRHYWKNVFIGFIVTRLGNTCANLWNREILIKIGGWNEELSSSQEYDLIFRIMKFNSKISFCPDYLSIIHEIPGSISRNTSLKHNRIENSFKLRESFKKYLIDINRFGFKEKVFYHGMIGSLSKRGEINFPYSLFYFYFFKLYKFISFRFFKSEYSIN